MMMQGSWPTMQHGGEAAIALAGNEGNSSNSLRGLSGDVVELALLLTSTEAAALESAAQANGMSVASLLRCVVRQSLIRWVVSVTRLENKHEGVL